ncbi:type II toxin-antitoxin system MqsR family toxin [Caldicellulosiruptor naganoensis]|uniref:Type II toxin-antitoxin system MqsR family toxin n=1 Tax=Caldicellulosiruptor naganoensis TaxID=29324 RepID=A0ABY7BMH5_9FIRM|nr:type II toxin-antitoxin system MqsR family toxin [Caldicellulosiruptor naganoensis]WAM32751.1 type II toxin-antitoxin system MqsR family toxin [Caldicellulosiruptor naganoensis]
MKKLIVAGKWGFVKREKNIKFLKEWGLLIDDVKDILLDLQPGDYVKGPEQDHLDGKEGDIWIFKNSRYLDVCIYIKLRYNPPEEVVCISFHEDESQEKGVKKNDE